MMEKTVSFPTEFPTPAIQNFVGLVIGKKPGAGVLALSAYDLVGYGLYSYFGDVKYLTQADPDVILAVGELVAGLPIAEVILKYNELKKSGLTVVIIILQLVKEFGPLVIALIRKLLERNTP